MGIGDTGSNFSEMDSRHKHTLRKYQNKSLKYWVLYVRMNLQCE